MTDDGCTENTKFSQPPIQQDKGWHTYTYIYISSSQDQESITQEGRKKELEKKSGEKTQKESQN